MPRNLLKMVIFFQIVRDPKNFPSQFQPTLPLPTPPPMLPPIRPQRQKIESPITDLSQDLKPESHDGWTFEENEYISITLLNTPFIDNKLFLAPEVCISIYFTRVLILHYRCESVSLNFKKLPKIALFTNHFAHF